MLILNIFLFYFFKQKWWNEICRISGLIKKREFQKYFKTANEDLILFSLNRWRCYRAATSRKRRPSIKIKETLEIIFISLEYIYLSLLKENKIYSFNPKMEGVFQWIEATSKFLEVLLGWTGKLFSFSAIEVEIFNWYFLRFFFWWRRINLPHYIYNSVFWFMSGRE